MISRLIRIGLIGLFIFSISAITYFSFTYLFSPVKMPVSTALKQITGKEKCSDILINPGTIVRVEERYACGDVFVKFQGPAKKEWHGLSEREVRDLYPVSAGWEISKLSEGIVELSKSVPGLCERHASYRHLGVAQGMLAVYQGPLGYNDSLIRVEKNIVLNSLPQDFQDKLLQAMDFNKQADRTKQDLRKQLEFPSEQDLNAVLDSIDEMSQGPLGPRTSGAVSL